MQRKKRNSYVPIEVHWSEVPARDDKWKKETIANTSQSQFNTEFECEFLGSIDTLITSSKLKTLTYKTPIQSNAGLDVYEQPQKTTLTLCVQMYQEVHQMITLHILYLM